MTAVALFRCSACDAAAYRRKAGAHRGCTGAWQRIGLWISSDDIPQEAPA